MENFSTRLAQQIEWAGGQTIRIETEPGINATYDQVKKHLITIKMLKHSTVYGMNLYWNHD